MCFAWKIPIYSPKTFLFNIPSSLYNSSNSRQNLVTYSPHSLSGYFSEELLLLVGCKLAWMHTGAESIFEVPDIRGRLSERVHSGGWHYNAFSVQCHSWPWPLLTCWLRIIIDLKTHWTINNNNNSESWRWRKVTHPLYKVKTGQTCNIFDNTYLYINTNLDHVINKPSLHMLQHSQEKLAFTKAK